MLVLSLLLHTEPSGRPIACNAPSRRRVLAQRWCRARALLLAGPASPSSLPAVRPSRSPGGGGAPSRSPLDPSTAISLPVSIASGSAAVSTRWRGRRLYDRRGSCAISPLASGGILAAATGGSGSAAAGASSAGALGAASCASVPLPRVRAAPVGGPSSAGAAVGSAHTHSRPGAS